MIIIERHEYTSFKKSLIVFNYFKKFKTLVEKKSDYSIKSLRIDRG
jgi:hypothetical protein